MGFHVILRDHPRDETVGYQGTGYVQYRKAAELDVAKKEMRYRMGPRVMKVSDRWKEFKVDQLDEQILSIRGPRISVATRAEVMHNEDGNWMDAPGKMNPEEAKGFGA